MDSRLSHVLAALAGIVFTVAVYEVAGAVMAAAEVVTGGEIRTASGAREERRLARAEDRTEERAEVGVAEEAPEGRREERRDARRDDEDRGDKKDKKDKKDKDKKEKKKEKKEERKDRKDRLRGSTSLLDEYAARRAQGEEVTPRDILLEHRAERRAGGEDDEPSILEIIEEASAQYEPVEDYQDDDWQ